MYWLWSNIWFTVIVKNGKFPTSKEICKAVENSKKVEHEKAKLKDKLPIH